MKHRLSVLDSCLLPLRSCLVSLLLASATISSLRGDVDLYIPHIIAGSQEVGPGEILDYVTHLELINFTEKEIRFRVLLRTDAGEELNGLEIHCAPLCHDFVDTWDYTLDPLRTKSVKVHTDPAVIGGLQSGWARIRLEQEDGSPTKLDVGIVVSLVTAYRDREVINATTILPDQLLSQFSTFARLGTTSRITAIALLNPSTDEEAEINFKLFDGLELFAERTITLAPRGKIAQFLDQRDLFVGVTSSSFIGSLEVQSTLPLAVTIVLTDHESWSTFRPFPPRTVPEE